eukprot:16566-Hanusia_phi.AAC.3
MNGKNTRQEETRKHSGTCRGRKAEHVLQTGQDKRKTEKEVAGRRRSSNLSFAIKLADNLLLERRSSILHLPHQPHLLLLYLLLGHQEANPQEDAGKMQDHLEEEDEDSVPVTRALLEDEDDVNEGDQSQDLREQMAIKTTRKPRRAKGRMRKRMVEK